MTNLEFIENAVEDILNECPEKVEQGAFCHVSSGDYDYGDGTLIIGEVSEYGNKFEAWLTDEYQEVDMNKDFVKYLKRHNLTVQDYLNMREAWDKMPALTRFSILKEDYEK